MKRNLIGIAAAASLLATSAFAADLPARTYTKAPVYVDPGYNWTGFYVGANGGYSWGDWSSTSPNGLPIPLGTSFNPHVDGWVGGLQAGYNWQTNANWVLGVEADIQATGERASSANSATALIPFNTDFHFSLTQASANDWDFPWFATFRGRLGWLADPQTLLYGTVGLAVGEFKFATTTTTTVQRLLGATSTTPSGAPIITTASFSDSQTRVGGAVGLGVERKFDRNWSGKLEYLYLDFGTATYFGGTASQTDVRLRDHVVRVGINYAFNPGPVVAKY
jgi:outer membrane immunogenic protein